MRGGPMIPETPCPNAARLKGLLESSLPAAEQSALVGHLDSCTGCQHSLEEIAAGGSPLSEAGPPAAPAQPPAASPSGSALRQPEGAPHPPDRPPPDPAEPARVAA